jgi:hypothetical protein
MNDETVCLGFILLNGLGFGLLSDLGWMTMMLMMILVGICRVLIVCL